MKTLSIDLVTMLGATMMNDDFEKQTICKQSLVGGPCRISRESEEHLQIQVKIYSLISYTGNTLLCSLRLGPNMHAEETCL